MVEDEMLGKGFKCTHFKPLTPEEAVQKVDGIVHLAAILITQPQDSATDLQSDATKITSFFS